MIEFNVLEDTGWIYRSSANPRRGFHDYERTIVFDKVLSEEQVKKLTKDLDEDPKCPAGQMRVSCYYYPKNGSVKNTYTFHCGLDSSD